MVTFCNISTLSWKKQDGTEKWYQLMLKSFMTVLVWGLNVIYILLNFLEINFYQGKTAL